MGRSPIRTWNKGPSSWKCSSLHSLVSWNSCLVLGQSRSSTRLLITTSFRNNYSSKYWHCSRKWSHFLRSGKEIGIGALSNSSTWFQSLVFSSITRAICSLCFWSRILTSVSCLSNSLTFSPWHALNFSSSTWRLLILCWFFKSALSGRIVKLEFSILDLFDCSHDPRPSSRWSFSRFSL